MWFCLHNRPTDQWNKMQSSEIHMYIHGPLIFDKVWSQFSGKSTMVQLNNAITTGYQYAK